jgi:DNA-binding transcriptional ArsR family regulator
MSDSEETIYSTMFSSLKHPARRKILRVLSEKTMTFSQLLDTLEISSSNLTYHLDSLGELLYKTDGGEYKLSTFGVASVNTMKMVEDAPVSRKRFWSLSLPWKTVFSILTIAIILLSVFSVIQYNSLNNLSNEQNVLESKYTQLLSWSAGANNAHDFLHGVLGIDTAHYDTSLQSNDVEQNTLLGGVVEQTLQYSLTSSDSKFNVIFRFRSNRLSRYQITLVDGVPVYSEPQPISVLDSAKQIVENLKSYENAPYLDNMSKIANSLTTLTNAEVTDGNMKLTITISGQEVVVLWMYTENGVDFSPKSLRLTFEGGVLTELLDGYYLFTIGNTNLAVSSDKAIQIARNAVKGFKWNADGTEVSSFNVLSSPVYAIFHPMPRDSPLALVPYWQITLCLDKVYPGGYNRIAVGVWADTGEVASIQPTSGSDTINTSIFGI